MGFDKKYSEIIADDNREKERASVEDTFARLLVLAESLDEDELALFELLCRENIGKKDRERVKQASRQLLAALTALRATLERWTEKEKTQADVQVLILNEFVSHFPNPPYTPDDAEGRCEPGVRLLAAAVRLRLPV